MTANTLIAKLEKFKRKQLIDAIDEIRQIARQGGCPVVNIIDPDFNTGSIDNEPMRLNVRIDENDIITSFTIG